MSLPTCPRPDCAPIVLPTVDEVVDIIKEGGFYSVTARVVLGLIAARVPVWQPVEPGTVIKAGTVYRIDWEPGRYNCYPPLEYDITLSTDWGDGRTCSIDLRTVPAEPVEPVDPCYWTRPTLHEVTRRVLTEMDREAARRTGQLHKLVADFQANGNSRGLGDPTAGAWFEAAQQVLDALNDKADR